jgi:hypothetical protein
LLFITCLESPLTDDRPTSSKDLYTICLGSHHLALTKVKGIRRKCRERFYVHRTFQMKTSLGAPCTLFLANESVSSVTPSHLTLRDERLKAHSSEFGESEFSRANEKGSDVPLSIIFKFLLWFWFHCVAKFQRSRCRAAGVTIKTPQTL